MLSAVEGCSGHTKLNACMAKFQLFANKCSLWKLLPRARTGVFCLLQDLERVFPVLTLHFSYIRKDRQKRKYVVLDDCPEQCLQVGEAWGGGSVTARHWILPASIGLLFSEHRSTCCPCLACWDFFFCTDDLWRALWAWPWAVELLWHKGCSQEESRAV